MNIDWKSVVPEVLDSLGLDQLFAAAAEQECHAYGDKVTEVLKDDRWSPAQRDALRFVGALLSMMLQHGNPNEPFGPMFVMDGQRSSIPSDFPREVLMSLVEWAQKQACPEFRARLLDVIWVGARSFPAAQGAVSSYIESAKRLEDPKQWTSCAERLERAVRLAAGLGKGGVQLRTNGLTEIEAVIDKYKGTDPLFLTYRLTSILLEFKHCDAAKLADYTTVAAQRAQAAHDFWRAKDYFELAAKCFDAAGKPADRDAALRLSAEALALEAESAASSGAAGRGAMAGASIMAQAVDAMRQAPGGKDRADALHARLLELQQQSLSELKQVSTTIDIAELTQKAVASVEGKPLHPAIIALCQMSKPPTIEKLREQVRKEARIAVLSSMFSNDIINSRGRVVAKAPPLKQGEESLDDNGLRFRMFRHARQGRDLVTQALINPARTTIFHEHNPCRLDLYSVIQHSPWIPPGHVESIIRVLVAGFQGDMLIVAHMVAPQLEAVIRHIIELRGGNTAMFDPEGLQPEKSLNVLLTMDEAKQAFSEQGVFELQDVLVDQLGTNLRNEIAHGLLSDEQMFSSDVLYAWWLLLRFCVLSSQFASTTHKAGAPA